MAFPAICGILPRMIRLLTCLILLTTLPIAAADSDHWAFQAIKNPSIPSVKNGERVANPIDAFVVAKLDEAKWAMSPQAPPETLLRRLHLDLTGLLPAPSAIEAFEKVWQTNPDQAYREKVDELLASPHFGEQWGRHWLDIARYGESDGYLGDTLRHWAWIYRDWVVESINADQPYDQFSIEQLAGDLLPNPSQSQKIAAGFHRNNLKNTEAGLDKELARTKQVVDRVATTGNAWLGLTVACAECHDHKHDPISQREFFELYAFFNNSQDADISVKLDREWPIPRTIEKKKPKEGEEVKEEKIVPKAQTLVSLSEKERRKTHIHIRGDYSRPGEEVTPATPAVLHPMGEEKNDPDRLALAKWLFSPENPLTARVAVNQIWQQLFGTGIVSTPDDFGTHGSPPSHPELLDWLAHEFRNSGWSRKSLIRTIVLSSTYRQSSLNTQSDRPNALLWRQNSVRVNAETVRDLHLVASGLLTPTIGGPSVHPPLPEFVTKVGRSVKWPESTGPDRYRRGLYIFLKRTVLYPMLTTFDAPDTSASCSRRENTNTPMQALTLLNDPVFYECAEVLGRDLNTGHGDNVEAAVEDLFLRSLNREPTAGEMATLLSTHHDFQQFSKNPELAMIATARVVMNLDEFITRD